jgi:hypothetical protein
MFGIAGAGVGAGVGEAGVVDFELVQLKETARIAAAVTITMFRSIQ